MTTGFDLSTPLIPFTRDLHTFKADIFYISTFVSLSAGLYQCQAFCSAEKFCTGAQMLDAWFIIFNATSKYYEEVAARLGGWAVTVSGGKTGLLNYEQWSQEDNTQTN